MIRPEVSTKNKIVVPAKQQSNIRRILATILAFISVFIFFLKILFL